MMFETGYIEIISKVGKHPCGQWVSFPDYGTPLHRTFHCPDSKLDGQLIGRFDGLSIHRSL